MRGALKNAYMILVGK